MRFIYSSFLPAPVEVVWRFHDRPDVLQLLTPPWQPVEIVRREGGLAIGAVSGFRLWLGIIPVDWLFYRIRVEPYRCFVDRLETGPVRSWIHTRLFAPEYGGCRLTDIIDGDIAGDAFELIAGGWVNDRLRDMFRYRHTVTREYVDREMSMM